MSRAAMLLILGIASLPQSLSAQTANTQSPEAMIERSKKLTAVDKNGCLKPEDPKEIVVCGEPEETKKQRVFKDEGGTGPNDPNFAARNRRAAACIPGTGCILPMSGGVGIGFGKVPPPAIPLEEVYRGLPEPDMIVPEGEGDAPQASPPPEWH
jgi:hypothetical protein